MQRPSHKSSLWAGSIAILLLLTFIFYRLVGQDLYEYPTNPDLKNVSPRGVIVCLAGGTGRIETAFELFANGYGEELLIIGAGPKTSLSTLLRTLPSSVVEKLSPERLDQIFVERESRNTIENAYIITQRLKHRPKRDTMLLITSSYHMRRSLMILKNSLPQETEIIPFTPMKEQFSRNDWFKSWLGIQVTGYEYLKFLVVQWMLPYFGSF